MPEPQRVRAPGRVNLIGDHTDYQDGFCLPIAIDREVTVECTARPDSRVQVEATDALDADGRAAFDAMVAAAVAVLAERGVPPVGIDERISSTLAIGAGLSSSAAVEVALCLALATAAGASIGGRDLALAAQAVEHHATGVPCGVLDQMASVFGVAGHALLLDCRALTIEALPLPRDIGVVVVHSGVARRLAGSEYSQRRAACEAAAARLGVATLRDATGEQVADDPIARHVVTENARTLAFAAALRTGRLDALGTLMLASHASLAHDFRVSTPDVDRLVETCMAHGALGARMTGGGFGGCVVALFAGTDVDGAAGAITHDYGAATGLRATPFVVRAVDGAAVL